MVWLFKSSRLSVALILFFAHVLSEIGKYAVQWDGLVVCNLKFLSWNAFSHARFTFEHVLLVRTCDVFESTYFGSLVSKVFQVGSVRSFFFALLAVSWADI